MALVTECEATGVDGCGQGEEIGEFREDGVGDGFRILNSRNAVVHFDWIYVGEVVRLFGGALLVYISPWL